MKVFSSEELQRNDGQDDRPVHVAHQGRVFDLSGSNLWKGGLHMNRHRAGADLTTDIKAAPHGPEVLERYPRIGELRKDAVQQDVPPRLARLLRRVPMLRRHPHPMTVHFPIAFMTAATLFTVLYLLTGSKSFDVTALHCLGAGIVFTCVAVGTGFYTWWLNYMSKPVRAVIVKRILSLTMLGAAIVAFAWRAAVPNILAVLDGPGTLYLLLVLSLFLMVVVIGWFGAELTFPVEKE